MTGPLPLDDVLHIVERRRRRRARVQTIAAPALSVAAVGLAGLVVVVLQSGPDEEGLTPAAPAISALPPSEPPPESPPPVVSPRPDWALPFDQCCLGPDFFSEVAGPVFDSGDEDEVARLRDDAEELARTWDLADHRAAEAVVAQARLARVAVDPSDAAGADVLVERFAGAGLTDGDAERLAAIWRTDERTARVMGGLLVESGYAQG